MAFEQQTPETPPVTRPGALRAYTGATALMALLILVQATLAGRWISYQESNLKTLHGIIGNVVFLLAVAQVALAFRAGMTGRSRGALIGMAVTLLVLIAIQIVLGYAGDDSAIPASVHIPTGVLIFGITMANISVAMHAQRENTD